MVNDNTRNKKKAKKAAAIEDFMYLLAIITDGQCRKSLLLIMLYTWRAKTKTPAVSEKNTGTPSSKKGALAKGRRWISFPSTRSRQTRADSGGGGR